MKNRSLLVLGGVAASLVLTSSAKAVITAFADRAAFTAAAGSIDINEGFSDFTADAQFRTQTVSANGFTLAQEGVNANFRNLVDIPPLGFVEHNGTAYVSSYTNAAEGTAVGTHIRVAFPTPLRAVGADFYNSTLTEGLVMEVFSGANMIASFPVPLPIDSFTFFGVVGSAGESIDSLRLRSATIVAGSGGEGFGMDDFALALVPEPASAAILASAFTGMLLGRSRRRR